MQVNAIENQTAAFGATAIGPAAFNRMICNLGIYFRVKGTAVGVAVLTVRWTEDGAAKSLAVLTVNLAVAGATPETVCIVRDINTAITVETAIVGLVGTPNYGVFTMFEDTNV